MHIQKKILLGSLVASLFSVGAHAHEEKAKEGLTYNSGVNSVTLYGLFDLTVARKTNADTKGNSGVNLQDDPWFSASRWGLKGQRDMGDGLSAIFKLESEFAPTTGKENAKAFFNRDAWAGFQSQDWGKLTVGRQNGLARDFSSIYADPYSKAQLDLEEGGYTNANNFKQLVSYVGSRNDRSIVWKKEFGPVVAGLGYKFGGVAGDINQGSVRSAALAYNGNGFSTSTSFTKANVAGLMHSTGTIGGNLQVNPLLRLNAGYFAFNADQGALGQRKDDVYTLSANFTPKGKVGYALGYQVTDVSNAALNASGVAFNPMQAVSAPALGRANGKSKTHYASAIYSYDKLTDFYVAADHLKLDQASLSSAANGQTSQTELAVGVRLKF